MSIKRKLAWALDRPGGRFLLEKLTNARSFTVSKDRYIGVKYDGMWLDRIDYKYIPRSNAFNYYDTDLIAMRRRSQERLKGSLDYWTFRYRPDKSHVVIDVGAGIGIDALALWQGVGRIYSIEAHPATFEMLKKTVEMNDMSNVTPVHLAISDQGGEVWITSRENDEENSVSHYHSRGATLVPALDLDSFVEANKIDRIDLLKMNIEGGELLALRGMKKSISLVRNIVIACHDFVGKEHGTKKGVKAFLAENGFEISERPEDERPYVRDHVHGMRRQGGKS